MPPDSRFSQPYGPDFVGPPLMMVWSQDTLTALLADPRTDVNVSMDVENCVVHCACLVHWCCAWNKTWRLAALLGHPRIDLSVLNRDGEDAWAICKIRNSQECLQLLDAHRAGPSSVPELAQQVEEMQLAS